MIGFQENRANELVVARRQVHRRGHGADPRPRDQARHADRARESLRSRRYRHDGGRRRRQRSRHDRGRRASASPITPSPRSPPQPPRGSTMATSPRCSMRRDIGATSSWRDSLSRPSMPSVHTGLPGIHASCKRWTDGAALRLARPTIGRLLHAQRHEAQLAVGVGDQQQHRLLAVLLELVDALLDVGGACDRLLRHLDDDVAGGRAASRRRRKCASTPVMSTPLTLSLIL